LVSAKKLKNFHKFCTNSKLWQTHSHRGLVLFGIVMGIAIISLAFGLNFILTSNQQSISDYLSTLYLDEGPIPYPNPTISLSEQKQFEVPTSYMNKTIPVTINFTLLSDSYFAQNTLFEINTTATVSKQDMKSNGIRITRIDTKQFNAIDVYPDEYSPLGYREDPFYSSYSSYAGETYLNPSSRQEDIEETFNQVNFFTFHDNGSLVCNVTFIIGKDYSNYSLREEMDSYLEEENRTFQYEATFTHHFSNLSVVSYLDLTDPQRNELHEMTNQRIQSSQLRLQQLQTAMWSRTETIQENSEKRDLGFTLVIFFLALTEISLIIYEQSADEEKQENYRYQKRYEKQKDIM
jgi:hypothetical protein